MLHNILLYKTANKRKHYQNLLLNLINFAGVGGIKKVMDTFSHNKLIK